MKKLNFKTSALFLLGLFISCTSYSFASDEDTLLRLLANRYSGYDYDSTREVKHDQVRKVVAAGQLAPSSYNEQPWRFIVCEKSQNLQAYEKALACLVEGNRTWAQNAPVLIICLADSKSSHNDKPNEWAQYDTGAASFSIMLQASSMGLIAHQMGGFDQTSLIEAFSIPENCKPMAIMAIGYASEEANAPNKNRRPVGENFFMGEWNLGFE